MKSNVKNTNCYMNLPKSHVHSSTSEFNRSIMNRSVFATSLKTWFFTGMASFFIVLLAGLDANAQNTPPTVSTIANQTTSCTGISQPLAFNIGDAETLVGNLTITATSSNTTLIPNANLVITQPNSSGAASLAYTPVAGQTGVSTITLTVTDGGGLTATSTFTITVTGSTISAVSNVVNDLACGSTATGSFTTTVTGGNAPFTYQWSWSGTLNGTYSTTFASPLVSPSPSLSPTNLYPGFFYRLTVTDACGTSLTSTGVQLNSVTAMTISATSTNVNCYGASTGTITAVTTNGATPITVTATNGTNTYTSSTFTSLGSNQRQFLLSNLPAGSYTVSAVDATSACNPSTTVTISQPSQLAISGTQTNIVCNGASTGAVDLSITGAGSSPATYTYAWSGPSSYTASTQDISSRTAGTYSVTVTDACNATASASFTLTQPDLLSGTIAATNVSACYGNTNGSIVVNNAAGGAGTYEYSINGTSWQSSNTFSNLAAGTYQVSIRDAATTTCVIDLDGSNGTILTQPNQITGTVTPTNVTLCYNNANGSIAVSVTGGSGAFEYSKDNGTTWQSSSTFSNLTAGTYQISVRDAANTSCVIDLDASTGTTLTQPTQLTNTNAVTNVACNGASTGSITATPAGGTPAYAYQWFTGSNTSSPISGATTATLSSRPAGAYTVQITDASGCTTTTTSTITEPSIGLIATQAATNNVSCFGGNDGSTGVNALFGTSPYTYAWTGPGTYAATTANISGLSASATPYTVVVTDNNGCTETISVTITQPTALAIATTQVDVLCFGNSTGSINATTSGGTTPYNSFAWTKNGSAYATTEDISALGAGTYVLTTTDNNGCTATATVNITQPSAALTLSTTQVNVNCNGNSTGSIDLTPAGGTSPYTYAWTGSVTTQDLSNLAAGTYNVTVTDNNGCTATTSATITQPAVPTAGVIAGTQTICSGGNPVAFTSTTAGTTTIPTSTLSYIWQENTNLTTPSWTTIAGATSATYDVPAGLTTTTQYRRITNVTYTWNGSSNSCESVPTTALTVTVNPIPAVTNTLSNATYCNGVAVTAIPLTSDVTGAVLSWTNNTTSIGLAASGTGTIPAFTATNTTNAPVTATITVTPTYTNNGVTCTGTAVTYTITVNPTPTVNAITSQSLCAGVNTTAVTFASTFNVSGTTYNWTNSNTSIGLAASGTGNIPAFTATNTTNANINGTITVTPTANGCNGTAQTFTITVRTVPNVVVPGDQTYATGATVPTQTFTGNVAGTVYNWTNTNTAIGIPAQGTGNIASFTATNNTSSPISGTITVTPSINSCTGAAQSYTITVDPTPNVADPANQTLCAGDQTTLVDFTGTTANTNYTWTNNTPSIGLAASGSNDIPAFTATNTTNAAVTATITVTPQAYVTQGYVWGAVSETGTLTLTAPAGKVFTTVAFASYGLPTGSNGNYAIGSCHSTTSSTVMSAAIGQSGSFSVVANNATFGDPCSGPGKTLAVKLGYGISVNGPSQDFTITVNPTPVIGTQAATICSGGNFSVTPTDGGGNIVPTGTTYTWTVAANANVSGESNQSTPQTSVGQTLTNLTNTVQTVVYSVTPVSPVGPCTGAPYTVTVTVNPVPVIAAKTTTICNNGTFTVTPTNGTDIVPANTTYSWPAPAAITGISGLASGSSASFVSGTLTNSTNAPIDVVYAVAPISGAAGNCVGATFTVTVTVYPTPALSSTLAPAAICSGTTFSYTATSNTQLNPTFSWSRAAVAGISQASATGSSASISETLTNTTNVPVSVTYVYSITANGCSATNNVVVVVNPTPVIAAKTVAICNVGTFTVTPSNGTDIVPANTTYTWSAPSAISGISGLAAGTSASSISGTLTNSTNAPVDVVYTVTPTSGANGNCVGASFTVTVTVNPTPALSSTLTPAAICSAATFNYTATSATLVSPTFAWTRAAVSGITEGASSGSTATISETLTNTTNAPISVTYVYAITANGCSATNSVVVVVNPTPTVNAITSQTLCNNATTNAVTFASTFNVSGTTYAWTNNTTSIGLAASGTGNIAAFTATNTSNAPVTATINVTPSANGCAGSPQTFTITVNPTPTVNSVANQVLCVGSNTTTVNFASTFNVSGTTYAWTNTNTTIGLAASGSGNIASYATTLPTPFNVAQVGMVTVTPSANSCPGTPQTFTYTVNPTPVIAAKAQTICTGTAFTIAPSNNITVTPMEIVPTGTQYTWTVPSNIVGATSQSTAQANISQNLINATSAPVVVVYTVTPRYTNAGVTCTGAPFTVTVTVNPTMTITNMNTTICTGSTFAITPVDGALNDVVPAGILYTWNITSNSNIAGASNQTNPQVNVSQTLANNAATTQQQIYTVTPQYTNAGLTCTGTPFTITVNVLSGVPSVNVGANQTICSNGTASFTVSTVSAETGYWATTGNGAITPNVTNIPTITYNPAAGETGNVNIMYYATNACGTNNDVAVLTITALPSAGTISGTTSVCINSTTALSSSVAGGTWSSSNLSVASVVSTSSTTGVVTGNAVGTATITYTVTSGGCTNTTSTTVTVNSLPTATISAAGSTTFCDGGSVTLMGPSAPAGMTYTYAWNLNNAAITGATSNSYTASASGNYTVTVTNNNGCTATSAATVVIENPLPSAGTITGTASACVGSSSTLLNATGGGTWSTSNTAIATVNASTGVVTGVSAGTATITYTVTDGNGCTNSTTASFTVNGLPALSAIGGANALCAGSSTTLSNTTSGGAWSSSNMSVATINQNTGLVSATAAGSTIITYTVINSNGCTNSVTMILNVNALPTATVTAGGSTTICAGGSVSLSANAGTGYTYQWSNGSADQTISVSASGSYTVTVTDLNGCSTTSAATAVTVTPLPTVASITGNTGVCVGSTTTMSSATTGGVWTSSNTGVATISTGGVVTGVTAGTTTITYTVTVGGCTNTATTTVTVNSLPTATIAAASATTFCDGGSVTLMGPSAPAGMTYTYVWNLNGTAITGATGNTYIAAASGSYTVTVTNNNGCSATSAATVVTENPLPTVAAITGTTAVCVGSGTTLANATTGGTWSSSNTATATVNASTGVVTGVNAGTVTITYTVTNSNGCTNTSTATVTVNALPTPTITASGATTFCSGSSVVLTASSASTYQWNLNGTAIAGATSATYTATAAGSYSVTVTNANGCTATSGATSVTVNALPTATVTAGGSTTICAGGSVSLSANAGTGYTYQWSNGSADQTISVSASGSYTVTVTDLNGCSTTSAATAVTVTPLPTVASITGNTGVCVGSTTTMSSATTGGVWTSSNTGVATISTGGVVTGVTAGTTTITYTVTVGGCTNTATTTVTVNSLPTATIAAAGSTTICQGGSVALAGPSAPAGMTYTYVWNLNGTAITGATGNTYLATAPGNYTVTVTTNSGCVATSAITTVNLTELDWANTQWPASGAICVGGTYNIFGQVFEAGVTPAAGQGAGITAQFGYSTQNTNPSTWTNWFNASFNTQVGNNDEYMGTFTGLPAGTYFYAFRYSLNGCTYQYGGYSAGGGGFWNGSSFVNGSLTINAAPVVAAITGATNVCTGATTTLESATTGGVWTSSNTAIATVSATGVVTGVSAGLATITYTVTNASGCVSSVSADVNVNAGATATITAGGTTTFCAGGSVTLTASTGASYLWSNGAQTQSITVTAGGSYYVTVTNASGCSATSAATTVTVNPLPTANILANGPLTFCQGGSVTLSASPVVAGNTYLWSNGATTSSINVTSSATITVTVTSAAGCSTTSLPTSVNVFTNPTATITATGATTFCQGGSVVLTANAGTGFSYQWSNNTNNQTTTVSTAGSYTVTVTDANGCSVTSAPTVVTVNPLPTTAAITGTSSVCIGGTTLLSTTATNPVWSSANTAIATVAANGLVTGVNAGTVVVSYTITNANGCTNTASVTVTVNQLPTAAIATVGATTFCQGGSVTLLASNAPAGMTYTYQWRLNGTAITGATANTFVANASGNYSVTITTNSGCAATSANTTVTVNALPVLAANTGTASVCENGTVTLANAQAGGLWSTANNTVATINAVTGVVTGINPGTTTLTYTFTNANGCTNSVSTNFTVNALPAAVITANGPTAFCQGGSVTLTANAGSSYLWSTGATTQSITVINTSDVTVTVTNANGCSATSAVTSVVVNANPVANITSLNGNTFCQGASVTLVASTGASYAWSNGAFTQSVTLASTQTVTVTVTNADGCSATSAPFTVTMNPAPVATVTANGPTTFCAGGSVVLTAPTAAAYLWNSGETTQTIVASVDGPYSVTITDGNGCTATSANTNITVLAVPAVQAIAGANTVCAGSTTTLTNTTIGGVWTSSNTSVATVSANGEVTGVAAGTATMTYTVTNANGCSNAVSFTMNINATPVLTAIAGTATVCEGATTTLANAQAGGTWSSSDVAIATVAANGVVSGLSAGSANITYTYTNAAGCTSSVAQALVVNALPVATVTASGATTFCAGGSVTLTAPAGMTYAWSTGEPTQAITVSTSGNYTVTITNANACSATSAPVAVTVNALPTVSIANIGATTFCQGGSVTLISPLNSTYSYSWNNGATAITGASNNTYVANASGSYTLTITDANGCTATSAAIPVTVNALPVVTAAANGPTTFCAGGSVTLTATGAATYAWSNGATTPSITVNASDVITVVGTTVDGCSSTSNAITVTVNALPVVTITSSGSTACLGSTVTLTANGGATYSWSNNATTPSINVTAGNTYTVTATSAAGCTSTASETVTFNANPAVTVTANGPTVFCQGGSLTLTATGGSNYVWSNGDQGASTTVNQSGSYFVTVTNAAGCTTQSSLVNVTVNAVPVVAAINGANSVCEGGNMTLTSATAGGVWTSANNFIATIDGAGNVTGLNAGSTTITYTVSVNGCTASTVAQINILNNPVTPTITASGATSLCPGGSVVLFASNAANYQWSNGPQTPFIVATQSGAYTVTATGLNGCSATSLPVNVFIGDNTAPVLTAPLNVTVTPNLGCEAIGVALGTPVTSDNCSVASVTNDAPAIFPIGTTTVTWTVTDGSGNTTTATQLVTVVDQTAPTVFAPANVTVSSNNFCEATGVDLGTPNATDNCTNNLTITNNAPATYPLGTTTVTWTVTDAAGNITTVDQTVTVIDETAPVVLLASTSVILDANGNATIAFEDLDNGSFDNCGIASVVISQSEFDCSNVGNNLLSVTITDNSGNQTTAQVLITVIASDACGGANVAGPSVPDAFTPNGNNFNDTWVIPGLEGYNTKEMTVYSRYGTLVYYSTQYNNDWDGTLLNTGTPVPDGTYYYILNLDGGKQLNGYVYINRVKQ
jgi:gliding motility-associated-like protein